MKRRKLEFVKVAINQTHIGNSVTYDVSYELSSHPLCTRNSKLSIFGLKKISSHTCTLNVIVTNMFLNNPGMKQSILSSITKNESLWHFLGGLPLWYWLPFYTTSVWNKSIPESITTKMKVCEIFWVVFPFWVTNCHLDLVVKVN